MTLTQAALGQMSLMRQALVVLAATMFIAVAAQISVPFYPVPLTLQTLAILLVGFALGARLGAIAVLAYLAEGAMGLPVFANFNNGAAFAGPTAGFLVGFVALAWIAGKAADMGVRGIVGTTLAAALATAVIYIPGLAWPLAVANATGISAGWAGADLATTLGWFATPFLLGDAVKAVLAALIVTGGWKVLSKR
ncbi:biotin transporter BioY [Primorskyibacter sp. S187A]|uniref:biotin transporter BioY n=1 Tax=Primorskyibacter sp. S187A TaxID=3415130 RepID=UPI003C7CC3F8